MVWRTGSCRTKPCYALRTQFVVLDQIHRRIATGAVVSIMVGAGSGGLSQRASRFAEQQADGTPVEQREHVFGIDIAVINSGVKCLPPRHDKVIDGFVRIETWS
jgi:hypothetical protein